MFPIEGWTTNLSQRADSQFLNSGASKGSKGWIFLISEEFIKGLQTHHCYKTSVKWVFRSVGPFEIIFITVSLIVISHASLPAPPGGLGAVRRRLRRVVPPGVRGSVVWNGRERRLHLRGLLPEGRRHLLRWQLSRRGSRRGECHSAVHVHVRRRAEPAVGACRGLLVSCALHVTPQPSSIPSAAAGASAGQLALKGKFPGLHLNTVLFTKRSILASFSTCETVPDLRERTGLYLGLSIMCNYLN